MTKNTIIIISFVGLFLVVVIPPIIYGYIYPNVSEDTANNINFITQMVNGTLPESDFRYWGYAILGYPLFYLSKLIHVEFNIVFTWFHALLPLFIGCTLYFVFSRLVNWVTGLLALVIPIFVSGATVYYIYQGILFNLINITILYPLFFYFAIQWFSYHRIYQLILTILFAVIVCTFHTSGLYLPFMILLSLAVYLAYVNFTHKKYNKSAVILGSVLSVCGIIGFFGLPYSLEQIGYVTNSLLGKEATISDPRYRQLAESYKQAVPLYYYVSTFISLVVVWLFGLAILKYKNIKFTTQSKLLVLFLSCLGIVLVLATYSGLSTLPFRQQTDFAIVFAIITTILVGIVVYNNKKILVVVGLLFIFGLYPQFVPQWFMDNSAIKNADKQAIEYMNALNSESYTCSPSVSERIYNAYLISKYKANSDIMIVRNIPMAQGCDVNDIYYNGHGAESLDGYQLDKTFDDGVVKVEIYKK